MNNMQRRDFLTTAGRYTLYGALAAIAAFSLKNAVRPSGNPCTPGTSCRDCNLLSGCTLEEAPETKLVEEDLNS